MVPPPQVEPTSQGVAIQSDFLHKRVNIYEFSGISNLEDVMRKYINTNCKYFTLERITSHFNTILKRRLKWDLVENPSIYELGYPLDHLFDVEQIHRNQLPSYLLQHLNIRHGKPDNFPVLHNTSRHRMIRKIERCEIIIDSKLKEFLIKEECLPVRENYYFHNLMTAILDYTNKNKEANVTEEKQNN